MTASSLSRSSRRPMPSTSSALGAPSTLYVREGPSRSHMDDYDYGGAPPPTSRRDADDRRRAEDLAHGLAHIDFPLPTLRDVPQPIPPRIFPPHMTDPSERASRKPELSRQMSVHQLQQGYTDSASGSLDSSSRQRPAVEYPMLSSRPAAVQPPAAVDPSSYPHLWRSSSIVAVPSVSRPPRPPKTPAGSGSLLFPSTEMGRGALAGLRPLRWLISHAQRRPSRALPYATFSALPISSTLSSPLPCVRWW
jgi:hypothetical protein